MAVRITVHKQDLEKHKEVGHQLSLLSKEIKEFKRFCCYTPKGDFRLVTDLLDRYRISYGVHSDHEIFP